MVQNLRTPTGRAIYGRRKAILKAVFRVLKQQRGLRHFRLRELANVVVEIILAATANNFTRIWRALAPK
jgi:hypothetical protein